MKTVILQPMYIPWMGYFGMMQQADTFIFHDDIEFVRQSWQRRNQIKLPKNNGGSKWLSVPVEKNQGQNINEVRINNHMHWQDEHWSEIENAYSEEAVPYGGEHAEYFDEYADVIRDMYQKDWEHLCDLTTTTVETLAEQIGVGDLEIRSTSEMGVSGVKTDRVINILNAVGADEYISGPGAKDYLEVDSFRDNGISLCWHDFTHPEYPQPYGEFQSHMSAIDFLFNVGPDTERMLREAETGCLVEAT